MRKRNTTIYCMTIIIALLIFLSSALAQSWPDQGHPAYRVSGGTFNESYGNFIFPTGLNLTADSPTFHVDSTNNRVGIGTTTPSKELEVSGEVDITGNVSASDDFCIVGNTCLSEASSTGGGWTDVDTVVSTATAGDSVGIGTSDPDHKLHVQGGTVVGNASGSGGIISANTGVFGSGDEYGVYGTGGTQGVRGQYDSNNYGYLGANGYGVYGTGTTWAGYFNGNATITKSLFLNNAITSYYTYSIALSAGDGSSKNIGGFFNGSNFGVVSTLDKSEVESDTFGSAVLGSNHMAGGNTGDVVGGLGHYYDEDDSWVGVYGLYNKASANDIVGLLANGTIAVYGKQGEGTHAAYLDGNTTITGNLTIGTGTILVDGQNSQMGIGTIDVGDDALHVIGTLNATDIVLANNCADGDILEWSGGVGTCGTDDAGNTQMDIEQDDITIDSTVTTLDFSNAFYVRTESATETRVGLNISNTCTGSQGIEGINPDGTITQCETDSSGISSWALYVNGGSGGSDSITSSGMEFNSGAGFDLDYDTGSNRITFNAIDLITGSGTNDRIPKFTGTNTIGNSGIHDSYTGGGAIYLSGSNVGISVTPSYQLDVFGGITASILFDRNNAAYYINPANSYSALFNGNVGVDGDTNPLSKLSIGTGGGDSSAHTIYSYGSTGITSYGTNRGAHVSSSNVGIRGYSSGGPGIEGQGGQVGVRCDGNSGNGIEGSGGAYGADGFSTTGRGALGRYSSDTNRHGMFGYSTIGAEGQYTSSGNIGRIGYNMGGTQVALYGSGTGGSWSALFEGNRVQIGNSGSINWAGEGDLFVEDEIEADGVRSGTSSSYDLYIASSGGMGRYSSTRRDKTNITPYVTNFSKILDLEPMIYHRIGDPLQEWEIGYIAEDVYEAGLEMLVEYNEPRNPESIVGIKHDLIILYPIEVMKEQRDLIQEQAATLEEQAATLSMLEQDIELMNQLSGVESGR